MPNDTTQKAPRVVLKSDANVSPKAVKWLWPGWLARGKFHVLAGEKGAGKSTLVFSLFAALTTGGEWPDGTRAPVGDVLVWSSEDDFEDTSRRHPAVRPIQGYEGAAYRCA